MVDLTRVWDVLVAGGGNAALSAAITARRAELAPFTPAPARLKEVALTDGQGRRLSVFG